MRDIEFIEQRFIDDFGVFYVPTLSATSPPKMASMLR
jgi:hypothetical protein